jgi:hypothetical protein
MGDTDENSTMLERAKAVKCRFFGGSARIN